MNTFRDNGGYIVKKETNWYGKTNVRYMDCKYCGRQVRNVGEEVKSVTCDRCFMGMMIKQFPELDTVQSRQYKPTGRPQGWHWMKEFVDKDGNVFHKGKEQPKLKGTLKPTKMKSPKKRKAKRRTRDAILVAHYKEKQALKKAVKKQKDFLNHKIDKG